MPDFFFENQYQGLIAGVDESGRGPLAGPVVAAAAIFLTQDPREIDFLAELDDSKKITKKKREILYNKIINHPKIISSFKAITNQRIDEINILNATREAMQESLKIISLNYDISMVLVDGNLSMLAGSLPEKPLIKGDSKSYSIAAASIVAKVKRDMIMSDLEGQYPQYNWSRNAGYPTKEHLELIAKFGVCPYHRKSYAPIKKQLKIA